MNPINFHTFQNIYTITNIITNLSNTDMGKEILKVYMKLLKHMKYFKHPKINDIIRNIMRQLKMMRKCEGKLGKKFE